MADPGPDRDPALRRRPQVRHVEIGVQDLAEGPRDRRRGHQQDVRGVAAGLRLELAALLHAEAVLLVDDDEAEGRELDPLLDERMGADDDRRLARLRRARASAGPGRPLCEPVSSSTGCRRPRGGRRASRGAAGRAGPSGRAARPGGPLRAAAASAHAATAVLPLPDVALEEPEHRRRPAEVRPDRLDRACPGRRSAPRRDRACAPIEPVSDAAQLDVERLRRPRSGGRRRGRAGDAGRPSRAGARAARRRRAAGARRRGPRTSPGSGRPRAPGRCPTSCSSARIGSGRYSAYCDARPVERLAHRDPEAGGRQAGREPVDRHDPADVEHLALGSDRLEVGVVEGQLPAEVA